MISEAIQALKDHGFKVREFPRYSFGTQEQCKSLLKDLFLSVDRTIRAFEWLPEYDRVAQWMSDTEGKGLLLTGDCGRGKTNIIQFVLPVLFFDRYRLVIKPVQSENLHENIEAVLKRRIICIDEMGAEPTINDYGTLYEPFNRVVNHAEYDNQVLLLSTNLNSDEIRDRYGERTLDRVVRLCEIVKFKGKSLRR